MSTRRKLQSHELPAARRINKSGVTLPASVMRAARRGVMQINRGEGHDFESAQAAVRFLSRHDRKK